MSAEAAVKTCTRCLTPKPLDEFYLEPKAPLGRTSGCRECLCAYRREQRNHPERATSHGCSGYYNWGCRCDVCRAASREYQREYRAARGAA